MGGAAGATVEFKRCTGWRRAPRCQNYGRAEDSGKFLCDKRCSGMQKVLHLLLCMAGGHCRETELTLGRMCGARRSTSDSDGCGS